MDDAWFHTFTSTSSAADTVEKRHHKRRPSLLQQPAEEKADLAVEAIPEVGDDVPTRLGPPKATLTRRAQSYSDFYNAVTSYRVKDKALIRRRSLDIHAVLSSHFDDEIGFDADFSLLADGLVENSHARYHAYHEQQALLESYIQGLLSSTRESLSLLSALSESFISVERQTDAFRQQCQSLISEQKSLEALAHGIDDNARYYTYLEPITRRLNAPGSANLVKGLGFPDMLANLDECLAYMESHPKHKDAATYRGRYRLLLTRALTLVRHHFTKSLGDIASDIIKRLQGEQLKETTHSALLYAKFRVPAPELKALGLEIQKRAVPTPDDVDANREPEYMSLMRELYQSYSATRGRLMLPLVAKKMDELNSNPEHSDVLAFSKASIAFMRGICLDEHELWFEWFETDAALYDFLESLMEPVSDYLRPKVVHENKLENLCELCAMIQGRYMEMDSDEDGLGSLLVGPSNGKHSARTLDFASLVQPLLEDAQTRLVFLALAVLRDGIENYRLKSEDLEWPKPVPTVNGTKSGPVLSGRRGIAAQASVTLTEGADDDESVFSKQLLPNERSAADRQWYPTLLKAIWLLRRIYRLVNSTVFDDLAHRIVHSTIYSLMAASQQITSKATAQDGQLFLITHLLYLKQQIVAFDIEFIPPEVDFDFSSLTNTFYELRDRGSLWNPASWVRLVGGAVGGGLFPKVVENMLDAKAELDGRLRTVINDFVNGYASHITAPIETSTVSQAKAEEQFDPLKAVRTIRGLAEKDVPSLRAKLLEFVDDTRTRETLVAAVRDQVVMSYEDFFDNQSEGTGRKLSRKGKAREDEAWGSDLFSEAMERVFQVGQVLGDDSDVNSDSDGGAVTD